jgi:hypothetical protein
MSSRGSSLENTISLIAAISVSCKIERDCYKKATPDEPEFPSLVWFPGTLQNRYYASF